MEIENKNNQLDFESFKDIVDFGKVFKILLINVKLILSFLLIGLLISASYYIFSTRTFSVNSLIQVYLNEGPSIGGNQSLNLMLGTQSRDINNLVAIYKSRSNLVSLIENLNLNLKSDDKNFEKIYFEKFLIKNNEEEKIKFFLKFYETKFDLFDKDKNFILENNYNSLVDNDRFAVKISSVKNIELDEFISFEYIEPSSLYEFYKKKIKVNSVSDSRSSFYKSDNLLQVSYQTANVNHGKKIINEANKIYINNNIKVESSRATKVLSFIDDQIKSLKIILDQNNLKLKSFKEENSSIDVSLEIKSIIEQLTEVEQNLSQLDLEIAESEINYTSSNPLYLNLLNQRSALEDQKKLIESQIRNLPKTQQKFINLFKDVEVSQALYTELSNQRLNYSILQASTIGNIRLIDKAYKGPKVSPRITNVIIFTFLFFIMGIISALIKGKFFTPIINPAEIIENGLENPLLGVIPLVDNIKSDDKGNELFAQSLESLVFNIKILKNENEIEKKVFLITSPSAENGKSFVSLNIAEKLSQIGNKVLLVDIDLKRGDLNKSLNVKRINKEKFFNINKDTLENYQIKNNFFFIPRISDLQSSFNFLDSNFFNKLDELKTNFDYLIIDSAPVLSVSDSSVLMSYADLNICIVRHDLTKINEIRSSVKIANQVGSKIDGLVYNGFKKSNRFSYYGGYEYSYYRDKYLYQTYQYKDEN